MPVAEVIGYSPPPRYTNTRIPTTILATPMQRATTDIILM